MGKERRIKEATAPTHMLHECAGHVCRHAHVTYPHFLTLHTTERSHRVCNHPLCNLCSTRRSGAHTEEKIMLQRTTPGPIPGAGGRDEPAIPHAGAPTRLPHAPTSCGSAECWMPVSPGGGGTKDQIKYDIYTHKYVCVRVQVSQNGCALTTALSKRRRAKEQATAQVQHTVASRGDSQFLGNASSVGSSPISRFASSSTLPSNSAWISFAAC